MHRVRYVYGGSEYSREVLRLEMENVCLFE